MKTQNDELVDRTLTPRLPLKIRNFDEKNGAGLQQISKIVKTDYGREEKLRVGFENNE